MSGFVNTARLALANLDMAGDKLEELIAGLNPDAAVVVGREERTRLLRVAAEKLAEQKQIVGKKEKELATVNADLKVKKTAESTILERSKSGGQVPGKTALIALDRDIKRANERAELLETEIAGTKTAISLLENMVEQRADALRSFDGEAEATRHRLDMANLRKEQADLQAEVQGIASKSASTAGLSALSRAADRAEQKAAASEIMVGAIGSQLVQDDIMSSILEQARTGSPKKSPLEELAALSK